MIKETKNRRNPFLKKAC